MSLDEETAASPDEARLDGDRKPLVAFAADAETEAALRQGLAACGFAEPDIRRGDILQVIADAQRMPTPVTLIVDVSGHPQPIAALEDLAAVVEPMVRVLAIGDRGDLGFYRQLTRGLGVLEYLRKPATPEAVARLFGPILTRRALAPDERRGGRVLAVTGARGGAGATTIAVNLAWFLACEGARHTILVDTDIHRGTTALLLGAQTNPGLRVAIEHPGRVDELFIERSVAKVADRLHLLATEERLTDYPRVSPNAADKLIRTLKHRYNCIILDVPLDDEPLRHEFLGLAQHRIIVLDPSLPATRDTARLLDALGEAARAPDCILVLNRMNRTGGMTLERVVEATGRAPDVIVPEIPRRIDRAALLGEPAATRARQLRRALREIADAADLGIEASGRAGRRRWFGLLP